MAVAFCVALPALAQDKTAGESTFVPARSGPSSGRSAAEAGLPPESLVGRAGQRRTREQVTGVAPMARIQNRVRNRVQSRINNRIGRNYNADTKVTSSFEAADEEAQRTTRPR